jgi:invasion protein IalB
METRDGEQEWRAGMESNAGIALLRNNLKKPTSFKRKPRSWQWLCRRASPTSVSCATSHDSSAKSRAGRANEVGFTKSHGKDAFPYLAYNNRSLWL